jgi:hypothetical protein
LADLGYEAVACQSEEEARERVAELLPQRRWPCYFFTSDTTGEKDFEEFFTDREVLDLDRFTSIGIINNDAIYDSALLDNFQIEIEDLYRQAHWDKRLIVDLFNRMIPHFNHLDTGLYLDGRM